MFVSKSDKSTSMLTLIATPLGNLADMPPRAIQTLEKIDILACEDTRNTGKLLQLLGVKAPKLVSYHQHNEAARAPELVAAMRNGQQVGLVSDSGLPAISDPGNHLVAATRAAGLAVTVVGAGTAVAAVAAGSGLASGGFVFAGFAPRTAKALQNLLAHHTHHGLPMVFYESPHRLAKLVESLQVMLGNQPAWAARELTKLHEEWLGPTLMAIATNLANRPDLKGECVLITANPAQPHAMVNKPDIAAGLAQGQTVRQLADALSKAEGISRNAAYAKVQKTKQGSGSKPRKK
jgi:16S rRNA (cytidine1402-2'-O)-methyltransferase